MRFSPYKNFVLLDELINGVAQKVPIPETLIEMYQDADEGRMPITWNLSSANDPHLGQLNSTKGSQSSKVQQNDTNAIEVVEASEVEQAILRMKRYRISHFFQRSRAAGSVIAPIMNAPASEHLKWFDTMLVPGSLLQAPGCRDEGLELLAMIARSEREYREAFEMTTPRSARYSPTPLEKRMPPSSINPARLRQIGFERNELIAFLNDTGISHALGESLQAATQGIDEDLTVASPSNDKKAMGEKLATGLTTPVMASILDGWCDRNALNWGKCINDGKWARKARLVKGERGKYPSVWDPFELAVLASGKYGIPDRKFTKLFQKEKALLPWLDKWEEYMENKEYFKESKEYLLK